MTVIYKARPICTYRYMHKPTSQENNVGLFKSVMQ